MVQYTALQYHWRLLEGDEQVATGGFETNARMEYDSHEAFEAGDAPTRVYHQSAYMKSRKQAQFQLRALGTYQGDGNWGKWREEKADGSRSAPLIVDGKEAFRIYLEVK